MTSRWGLWHCMWCCMWVDETEFVLWVSHALIVPPSSPRSDSNKKEEEGWSRGNEQSETPNTSAQLILSSHIIHEFPVDTLLLLILYVQMTDLYWRPLKRRKTDNMGASTSGLLDEAKSTHIKGKTRVQCFIFLFSSLLYEVYKFLSLPPQFSW